MLPFSPPPKNLHTQTHPGSSRNPEAYRMSKKVSYLYKAKTTLMCVILSVRPYYHVTRHTRNFNYSCTLAKNVQQKEKCSSSRESLLSRFFTLAGCMFSFYTMYPCGSRYKRVCISLLFALFLPLCSFLFGYIYLF